MIGMDRHTGRKITDGAHLQQSIENILMTPKGSLVMRRDYGSALPDLIDAPINGETLIEVYFATADALHKWEPRLDLERVQLDDAKAGVLALCLEAKVNGQAQTLNVQVTS